MSRYGEEPIDFGPTDNDYRGFHPGEEEAGRGPLILALAAGVLIVFGAVVYNTYRQGVRGGDGELPVISADNSPYKRRPDDAGGRAVPDQDRRIYDELDGSTREPAESILAGAPAQADGLRRSVSAEAAAQGRGGRTADEPMDIRPSQAAPVEASVMDEALRDLSSAGGRPIAPMNGPEPQVVALDEATRALAEREMPTLLPDPLPAAPVVSHVTPRFNFDLSGPYMVQVAALRDPNGAELTWNRMIARNPGLFAGAEKRVQRADLGARGTFYRLRVGAFADREEATAFCEAIKSSGNDCIVVQ